VCVCLGFKALLGLIKEQWTFFVCVCVCMHVCVWVCCVVCVRVCVCFVCKFVCSLLWRCVVRVCVCDVTLQLKSYLTECWSTHIFGTSTLQRDTPFSDCVTSEQRHTKTDKEGSTWTVWTGFLHYQNREMKESGLKKSEIWMKNTWLENEARLNETGNDWSAPELCSSDSSVTQVV
jgi:hypothetical protein